MNDISEITVSNLDEKRFISIETDKGIRPLPLSVIREVEQIKRKIYEKYIDKETTLFDVIWWVIIHPERDIKILWSFITIIGVFMNNFLGSWRTSLPSVILLLVSFLAGLGISLPTDFANIVTGGLIGAILLFSDWREFKKNFKFYATAVLTLVFWLLTVFHVLIIAPAVIMILIQIIIALVGMFISVDTGVSNVIKYSPVTGRKTT